MSETMEIAVEPRQDAVSVVHLTGRLDFSSAADARAAFADAVAGGHRKLVVDFDQVSFLDSAGLGALISGMRASRQAGGDLHIARPNQQVTTLLSLTSLDQVLRTYRSVEEAVDGFAS